MIGDDVTVAAIFVVAIVRSEFGACGMPVLRLGSVPVPDVGNEAMDDRVGGDEGSGGIEQFVEIGFDEGLCDERGNNLRAIDRLTIVTDTCGAAGEIGERAARLDALWCWLTSGSSSGV